jgi:hypothetical protein
MQGIEIDAGTPRMQFGRVAAMRVLSLAGKHHGICIAWIKRDFYQLNALRILADVESERLPVVVRKNILCSKQQKTFPTKLFTDDFSRRLRHFAP